MNNKEPFARVEYIGFHRADANIYVGDMLCGRWEERDGIIDDPNDICDTINVAIAQIKAKAELADRMVEKIRVALQVCEECGGGFFDSKPDQCPCGVIRKELAEYDRLNGKPEGHK